MLIKLVKIELLKTKRSLALLMMFLSPLMVVLINILLIINAGAEKINQSGWDGYWLGNFAIWTYFMLPLYAALITALLNGIEHNSNGWRYMASMPIKANDVFLAKYLLALIYLIGATLVLCVAVYLSIFVLHLFGFTVKNSLSITILMKIPYSIIASLAILTIQHIVSWRWKNIVVPLGLGVLSTMSILQFGSSKYWLYNPWTYMLVSTNGSDVSNQNSALLYSVVISMLLLVIARLWLVNREVTC